MLSAEDLAAVKIAVEVCCCCPKLKKQILIIPEKPENVEDGGYWHHSALKNEWDEKIVKSATEILEKIGVLKCQQEKVIEFVQQTGFKMLIWAKYHERFLGISRNFSVDFLNSSLFTSKGMIDNKKAAEELLKCQRLNIKQRYKLACLYCFANEISVLFKQMSKEEQEEFYISRRSISILQPNIVTFWSYHINGEIKTLIGKKNVHENLLIYAIDCRSRAAVEYCIEKANLTQNGEYVMNAVVKTLKNSGIGACYKALATCQSGEIIPYLISSLQYENSDEPWCPSCFYVDILCFLFHKLTEDQKVAILRKDIEGVFNEKDEFTRKSNKYSRILRYFCNWPFQEYFMSTANLMWDFLPEPNFVDLLEQISSKLKSPHILFGEAKAYNYKKMLMNFWNQSPKRFKNYVFHRKGKEISYDDDTNEKSELPDNVKFLGTLLLVKNFTNEDRRNFEVILASASDKEQRDIFFYRGTQNICIELMIDSNWGRLNLFVFSCLTSREEINNYKRKLCFNNKAKKVFIDFAGKQKWDAVDSFIKWSALSKEEIIQLKKESMLLSDFKKVCQNLIQENQGMKLVRTFCDWFSSSEEMTREFKKEFIYSDYGFDTCCVLVFTGKLEQANKFTLWCLSAEELIEYKEVLANRYESLEYILAISRYELTDLCEYLRRFYPVIISTAKFEGGMWEQVEMFLSWCFASVEEINDFKGKILYGENGVLILKILLRSNKWKEAETFLSWLGLSSDERRDLKIETVMADLFLDIQDMASCMDSDKFLNEWKTIQSISRWCLPDEESVLKFKHIFNEEFVPEALELENEDHEYLKKIQNAVDKFNDFLKDIHYLYVLGFDVKNIDVLER